LNNLFDKLQIGSELKSSLSKSLKNFLQFLLINILKLLIPYYIWKFYLD